MKEPRPDRPQRFFLNLGAVEESLRRRVDEFAASRGLSPTAAARFLILEALDRHEKS